MPSSLSDLERNFRVPPDMIDVDHDSNVARVESACQSVRFGQSDDYGTLGSIHRVQRLNTEFHTMLSGIRQQLADGLLYVGACCCDVTIHCGSAHEHQYIRPKRGRFLDGTAVGVPTCLSLCLPGTREPTAPAPDRHSLYR